MYFHEQNLKTNSREVLRRGNSNIKKLSFKFSIFNFYDFQFVLIRIGSQIQIQK